MSEAYREGDKLEKLALESRCERGARLLEDEISLRRTYEEKAQKSDKYLEDLNRMTVEVRSMCVWCYFFLLLKKNYCFFIKLKFV